jgi:hypothetical protein
MHRYNVKRTQSKGHGCLPNLVVHVLILAIAYVITTGVDFHQRHADIH